MAIFQSIYLILLCFYTAQSVDNGSIGRVLLSNKCNITTRQIFQTPRCLLCPVNALIGRCPKDSKQLTTGVGLKKCHLGFGIFGCVHLCQRDVLKRVCCKDYWGADCRPCPGLQSGKGACFGNGQCDQLEQGNGTCHCNTGFTGFACELCSDKTKFGLKCNQDCSCKNGKCNSEVMGNGTCAPYTCQIGYHGSNCTIFEKSCNQSCHSDSHCVVVNKNAACKCNPGYSGDGSNCEEIDPCKDSNVLCPKTSVCLKTGPGHHKCVCRQGYTGDGVVCSAIDPCQRNYGNCPNNTRCNYLGPGRSDCSCLPGYGNYSSEKGCTMLNLCRPDKDCLALNSECVMVAANVKECQCKTGYVGNGTVCYGNILERIDYLHGSGQNQNKFRHVRNIIKRYPDITFAFTNRAPFTIFLPTDGGLEREFSQSQLNTIINNKGLVHDLILVHSALAYLTVSALNDNGDLTTLKGWNANVTTKNSGLVYQLSGRSEKPRIIARDLVASNGILHVIDRPAWIPDFKNFVDTTSQTLWDIVVQRPELKTFRDFIQAAHMQDELKKTSTNGSTLIAPVNEAFSSLNDNVTEFLKSTKGKAKLQGILRHHIFGLKIDIVDIAYLSSIKSLAPEVVTVSVKPEEQGAVVLAEKSKLIENNIMASNGFLHFTDTLLIPSFVFPILQKRCEIPKIHYAPCRSCRLKFLNGNCPNGTVTTNQVQRCRYHITIKFGGVNRRLFSLTGCRAKCTPLIKQCCPGFYGADCTSCPGPIDQPCFGNGKCSDGTNGDGKCKCKNDFKGTACELCKSDNTYGLDCQTPCTCHHGTCDNGLHGTGSCVPGSCKGGYYGNECQISLRDCGGGRRIPCHVHAKCYINGTQPTCICQSGFEQVGVDCYEIDPCLNDNRGGCDKNAICTKTRPGQSSCTCSAGWTGDGSYCSPINYCATSSRGHCHRNAKCTFVGPAQVSCECYPGYQGDGTSCQAVNTCLKNNGNCSPLARCMKTGPGHNDCECIFGYGGDGYTCFATLSLVLKRQKELTIISSLIVKYNLVQHLDRSDRDITAFFPSDAAISNLPADKRKLLDWPENLFYFIGANMAPALYMSSELRNKTSLPSLIQVATITINHTKSMEPLIGGIARIIRANITASNGILHIVDKVLFPAFVKKPVVEPDVYQGLCNNSKTKFTRMCHFIKNFKLEDEMKKKCNICTIFAPTNNAFDDLEHDQHVKISRTDILYHMTNHYIIPSSVLDGQQFTSLSGGFYKLSFESGKDSKQVKVNGIPATRTQLSSTWIIYTQNHVLQAVKNICYRNMTIILRTQCRPCPVSSRRCRPGYRYAGQTDCLYLAFGSRFIGCKPKCERPIKLHRCCPGFYGAFCTACPGENNNPCFGRGKCHDTSTSQNNGVCECYNNYYGFACERCQPGYYGKDCKSCGCYGNTTCDQIKGFCLCPPDKKGLKCDKNATHTTCAGNVTCDQHASCLNGTCKCDYGFTGNGTTCKHTDWCEKNNGDCSSHARCNFDNKKFEKNCSCKPNYKGDGFYCRGINPCVDEITGKLSCHKHADCLYLRPGRAICKCKAGYSGDGEKSCHGTIPINACRQDNGGCSFHAGCYFNKTTLNTTCSCGKGYTGDGKICVGNVFETLQNDPNLREFFTRLEKSSMKQILSPENHVSIVAPGNDAFSSSSRRKRRNVDPISDSDLKYYIVSCVAISENDVKKPDVKTNDQNFVTVAGSWLNITSSMVINNNVKIISVKKVTNSVIFTVDRLLDIPDSNASSVKNMAFIDVAKSKKVYGKFIQLLTTAGMLDVISNMYDQPYTMFWPSDLAISRLPKDIKERLFSGNYPSELRDVLNYHIIENTKITTQDILSYSGGVFRRSREGSSIYISCKGHRGDLYINDRSKIIERDIEYREGIAFGISEVLLPPGVAGRCDEIKYQKVNGSCTACRDKGSCPPGTILERVDKNSSCLFEGQYLGCLSRCLKRTKERKCCKNFYGADCLACPGKVGSPCNSRGSCHEGSSGNGTCNCDKPFRGRACEYCENPEPNCHQIINKLCTSRDNPCSIFATCDVGRDKLCQCYPNYEGSGYYCQEIDKCQKNNGDCSKHAICRYLAPNLARCECRPGYVGDGYICTALYPSHPCTTDNGNCHLHAQCFDGVGAAVCRCREGFVGNGLFCAGTVKDVIDDIEDLSEFSKAFKQLSMGVEGNAMIHYLSSEKEYTVFAPINNGFTVKKMNINELKNHIVEGKLSFKPETTQTVLSMARNKINIMVSKNGDIRLNNIASVVFEYPATNGIVVVIDHLLPYEKPPPTTPPTTAEVPSKHAHKTTAREGSNEGQQKDNYGMVIGATVGAVVVVVLIIVVIYFFKKRRSTYAVRYNKRGKKTVSSTRRKPLEAQERTMRALLTRVDKAHESITTKNFGRILLHSEVDTEEDRIDDDDYEHQTLQHPSTEMPGTTLTNPTYMPTDEDIQDDLLEMTETSSIVPLTEHDAISSTKM